jgi:O-antigen ligase
MQFLRSLSFIWQLFRFSFVSLPYFFFAVFPGLVAVIGLLYAKFRRSALDRTTRNLLLAITGLLLLSCLFAANRSEAFLQLFNFLPYILLFSVLPYLLNGIKPLAQLATDVVIATIPINLLALVEYVLRADGIPRWLKRTALSRWYRARPHVGRAMVMFGHPNALASYLVLVLGLGLGLILYYLWLKRQAGDSAQRLESSLGSRNNGKLILLAVGTFACLLGIFASGSRNGLIVAVVQLLIFSLFTKASRLVLLSGLVGLIGIVAGAAWFGIGGRSLSPASWENDPRVGVWRFALGLLQQRPLLGWGLGNFKLQYPPGLIPDYKYIAHTHNVWLLFAVEAGIPLMLLLTLFVGRICYRAGRQVVTKELGERAMLLAYLLSFGGCIGFALFDVTFYDARINVMNWVVLAGLYAMTGAKDAAKSENL